MSQCLSHCTSHQPRVPPSVPPVSHQCPTSVPPSVPASASPSLQPNRVSTVAPTDNLYQATFELKGSSKQEYIFGVNHTHSGSRHDDEDHRVPGATPEARARFKQSVVQGVVRQLGASAASRGGRSVCVGDFNLTHAHDNWDPFASAASRGSSAPLPTSPVTKTATTSSATACAASSSATCGRPTPTLASQGPISLCAGSPAATCACTRSSRRTG